MKNPIEIVLKHYLENNISKELFQKSLNNYFEKSRAKALQSKHSGSSWKTINGAKVLIGSDGNVIAGAGGKLGKKESVVEKYKKELSFTKKEKVDVKREKKELDKASTLFDNRKKSKKDKDIFSQYFSEINKLPYELADKVYSLLGEKRKERKKQRDIKEKQKFLETPQSFDAFLTGITDNKTKKLMRSSNVHSMSIADVEKQIKKMEYGLSLSHGAVSWRYDDLDAWKSVLDGKKKAKEHNDRIKTKSLK